MRVDGVIEASNHFRCIDYIIVRVGDALAGALLKDLHRILKASTSDPDRDWFAVGDYKLLPNEVEGRKTIAPEDVAREVRGPISSYETNHAPALEDIVPFHVLFERIHPFRTITVASVGSSCSRNACVGNRHPTSCSSTAATMWHIGT